jgi:hypothetical protein
MFRSADRLSSRSLAALLAAGLCLPLATGCGEKKKEGGSKLEIANKCLADLMEARRKRAVSSLPSSDEGDEEHPWLAWIKKNATVAQGSDFKACGIKGEGTPAEETASTLARFFDIQKVYFVDEKTGPNEYMAELQGAMRVSKGQPFESDIQFELNLFHAAELARSWTLFQAGPSDDRVTRFYTYMKYIFGITKPVDGPLDEKDNQICNEKFADFCKTVPMESRPYALMQPYFEATAKLMTEYASQHGQSPYAPLAERMAKVYTDRAAKVPKYPEDPVLPAIRSTEAAPYSGNATLMITAKNGVSLMDNGLRVVNPPPPKPGEKPKTAWKNDFSADPALVKEVQTLVEDVRSSTVSQYNQSQLYVVAEGQVPVRYIEPLLRASIAGEHSKSWPTAMLVGRRKADGSNRRAGFQFSISKATEVVKFKLKAPGGAAQSCEAWAAIGKEQLSGAGFKPAVFHDGKQIHVGRLADDGTLQDVQSGEPHGDGDRLEKWADQQNMSIVVAVPESATYAQWLEALNGVALKCSEADSCKTPRNVKVFLATCR